MEEDHSTLKIILAIVLALIAIGLVLFAIFYRYDQRILVQDRYWVYRVDWQYTTTSVSTSCSTDSKGHTNCHTHVSTTTHTRCSDQGTGRDLPVTEPEHTCPSRSGDSPYGYSYGVLVYFAGGDESKRTSQFNLSDWDSLSTRQSVTATFNIFNNIMGVETH